MANFVAAGGTDQFQDGQMKLVTIPNHEILLARASGKYYAADGRCPHLGGRLWLGTLDGTIVTCPFTGLVSTWPMATSSGGPTGADWCSGPRNWSGRRVP